MKLVRAITAKELEHATLEGWMLTDEPRTEKRFIEHTRYVDPRYDPEAGRHVGGYNKTEVQFGDVLVFVVWKDADVASHEAQLQTEINRLNSELHKRLDLEDKLKLNLAEMQTLREKQDVLEAKTAKARDEAVSRNSVVVAQNRKLEADLAKVRHAIGELKMKEILGE